MKISSAAIIAIACVIGIVTADFGYGGVSYVPAYGYGKGGSGGLGEGGFVTLIGLLFLLMVILNVRNTSTTTSPTGGYIFVNVSS